MLPSPSATLDRPKNKDLGQRRLKGHNFLWFQFFVAINRHILYTFGSKGTEKKIYSTRILTLNHIFFNKLNYINYPGEMQCSYG